MTRIPIPPTIDPTMLRAGDVLLMRRQSPMSDLISWFGDSPYSHAAIMISNTDLVEAAGTGAHSMELQKKLQPDAPYAFIDAYRTTDGGGLPLTDAARSAIAREALALVGTPYPTNTLLLLAVYGALRNRIPANPMLRWALREALREWSANPDEGMVCSQLVYEAMQRGGVAPIVVVSGQLDLPFPDIDWEALWRQWQHATGRLTATFSDTGTQGISEEELATAYTIYRHPVSTKLTAVPNALGWPVKNPSSIDVMPLDLSASPQLRLLGRLPLPLQDSADY